MSELIQKNDNRATIRWKLLTGASALALTAYVSSAGSAYAEDSNHAQVWIELGAQLERASGGDGPFVPGFYSHIDSAITSPGKTISELPWAFGPEAKISFQPGNSDWLFSAGIRYGRSSGRRSTHQATAPSPIPTVQKYRTGTSNYALKCCHTGSKTPTKAEFADVVSRHQESHLILDFQAGKDVGLGLFGKQGSSVVSAGVRFAQFKTRSNSSVKALTDIGHYNGLYSYFLYLYPQKYVLGTNLRTYSLLAGSARDTKLIGPSLSWNASATLAGNPDSSELTFDWGINAAMLFGKQKAKTYHQSSGRYNPYAGYGGQYYTPLYTHPRVDHTRSRRVTVPNVGGMAGFSIKWPNAKISIGYRADIFFNAMDGGWDTAKKENRSFYGPFATISFGLGD